MYAIFKDTFGTYTGYTFRRLVIVVSFGCI